MQVFALLYGCVDIEGEHLVEVFRDNKPALEEARRRSDESAEEYDIPINWTLGPRDDGTTVMALTDNKGNELDWWRIKEYTLR